MAETHEVRMQILEVTENGGDVLVAVGAAAADGCFGVHIGALQEDGLAVEENARAVDAYVTEANVVGELVFAGR
jgi:hypothetical protein